MELTDSKFKEALNAHADRHSQDNSMAGASNGDGRVDAESETGQEIGIPPTQRISQVWHPTTDY